MEFGQHYGLAPTVMHDLNLALEEILTNIISYGYTDGQEHEIRVRLSVRPGEVKAEVEDDGQSFNPLAAPEPHTAEALEERTIGGLGIHLVRTLMDGLEYKRQADRNVLENQKEDVGLYIILSILWIPRRGDQRRLTAIPPTE